AKLTSEREQEAESVKRGALLVMAVVGLLMAATFALLAPVIARFERDAQLVAPLRLVAGIIACYAVYSVLVGTANGLRRFGLQASLDGTYTTLRATLILGGAIVGHSVLWATGGFLAAAIAILPVALVAVGIRAGGLGAFQVGRFL